MERICAVCTVVFSAKSSRKKTCSVLCASEHRKSVRIKSIASNPEKYREQRRASRERQRALDPQAYRDAKNGWNASWRARNIEKSRAGARNRARRRAAILEAARSLGLISKGEVFQ